jgi:hypothetical protein
MSPARSETISLSNDWLEFLVVEVGFQIKIKIKIKIKSVCAKCSIYFLKSLSERRIRFSHLEWCGETVLGWLPNRRIRATTAPKFIAKM